MFGKLIKKMLTAENQTSFKIFLSLQSLSHEKYRDTIIFMTAKCVQWLISRKIKKLNQGHCLIKKVAVSLLSAKQCIVALNTTDGSHHLLLDMQTHELFPCSADSFHC